MNRIYSCLALSAVALVSACAKPPATADAKIATTITGDLAAIGAKVQTVTANVCPGIVAKFGTLQAFTADFAWWLGYPQIGAIAVNVEKDAAVYCANKLAESAAKVATP